MRTVCTALVRCVGEDVKNAVGVLGPSPYDTATGEMLLVAMTKCGITGPILSPRSPITRETLSTDEQEERLVQVRRALHCIATLLELRFRPACVRRFR